MGDAPDQAEGTTLHRGGALTCFTTMQRLGGPAATSGAPGHLCRPYNIIVLSTS